jgi:hypothetical protein
VLIGIYGWFNSSCADCTQDMIFKINLEASIKLFLFFLVVIYLIWSLIEKKK